MDYYFTLGIRHFDVECPIALALFVTACEVAYSYSVFIKVCQCVASSHLVFGEYRLFKGMVRNGFPLLIKFSVASARCLLTEENFSAMVCTVMNGQIIYVQIRAFFSPLLTFAVRSKM